MREVAIVTDSTHYLPRELVAAHRIEQVSLYVGWGGERRRETDMASFDDFYARLGTAEELPTTSQPSIGDFTAVYQPLLEAGNDIVSVHLSSGISGTVGAAGQAKQLLEERGAPGRIEVVDSATAAGGLALLVLAAATAARKGCDVDAVAQHVRESRRQTRIWFCIDTLEYLRRGGRIGSAQAWLGGALRMKPILSIEHEITPVERVRTASRAFERMAEYLERRNADGADGWVIQHIQAAEQAGKLVERGRALFGTEPLCVSEVGPVLGTYAGPGMIGVGGLPRVLVGG